MDNNTLQTTPHLPDKLPYTPQEWAACYLDRGLAPIPLPTRSKDPNYPGWPSLRLKETDLERYFPPQSARNLGILNGAPSKNHLDVDLDCPQALRAAPLLLPPTGWVFGRLSTRAAHWIFRTEQPLDTAQEKYTDLSGAVLLELRGTGGHTVYPPSTHMETGEPITWDSFTTPAQITLDELRAAVQELAAASLLARHWPHQSSRDEAALALSGALARAGWSVEKTSRFAEAVAVAAEDEEVRMRAGKAGRAAVRLEEGRSVTGWSRLGELFGPEGKAVVQRVRQWLGLATAPSTVASVTARTKPRLRPIPAFRPFPTVLLPPVLQEYVVAGAASLDCDASYIALPCLGVVTSCIGSTRTIRLKRKWEEPAVLWLIVVAESGTLKSPAYDLAVSPLNKVEWQLRQAYKAAMAEYELAKQQYEAEKKERAKRGVRGEESEPPAEPVQRRVMVRDVTIEKLAEVLEDNPRGLLMTRDELKAWFGSFKRYAKGDSSDLPHWLEMHRAGVVSHDRRTGDRRSIFVPRAAVSVCGGIQPKVFATALNEELFVSGLVARILPAMPERKPKKWIDVEIAPEIEKAYADLLNKLLSLDFDVNDAGESVPFAVRLTPQALERWKRFVNEWGQMQAQVDGDMAAAYSKLEACAARLALVFHIVKHLANGTDDGDSVDLDSIEAGIGLVQWFQGETHRIYLTLAESPAERETRRLLAFIRSRGGRITVKELQRSHGRKFPKAEDAKASLDALAATGYGTWGAIPTTEKGGRPSQVFVLNPLVDAADETDETPTDDDDASGEAASGVADETPSHDSRTAENPGKNQGAEVSSVSSAASDAAPTPPRTHPHADTPPGDAEGVSSDTSQGPGAAWTVTEAPTLHYLTEPSRLPDVAQACQAAEVIGLDTETTGLDPRTDRVRLLTLATDQGTYILDTWSLDPAPLWPVLAGKTLIGHHLAFDMNFMARQGFTPDRVTDTMILSQLLHAGTSVRHRLGDVVERELGEILDKEKQTSNWSAPTLSEEQLRYAARDAEILLPLYRTLQGRIIEAGLEQAADIENRCLPALVWLATSGVPVDRAAWEQLARNAGAEVDRLTLELDAHAPPVPGDLGFQSWNWSSPAQVLNCFAALGITLERTDDDALAALDHPLARLLRDYRAASKLRSSYGLGFLEHVREGRVYASWRQLGAASGRMSCSDPNLQQVPRGPYRQCIAAPPGRVLVKADYSQIELRIAAQIADEKHMIAAFKAGQDLHTLTAQRVLGVTDVNKDQRQLAKAVNFGLLFGLGHKGFRQYAQASYGVTLTEEQAATYRRKFFLAYPKLAQWHRQTGGTGDQAIETRTIAGRRRLDVKRYTEKLNTPVQGSGADGLKAALALLWERRHEVPGAFPVLAVHDEIVIECSQEQAQAVADWLQQAMLDAMQPLLPTVPVEATVKSGATWGG